MAGISKSNYRVDKKHNYQLIELLPLGGEEVCPSLLAPCKKRKRLKLTNERAQKSILEIWMVMLTQNSSCDKWTKPWNPSLSNNIQATYLVSFVVTSYIITLINQPSVLPVLFVVRLNLTFNEILTNHCYDGTAWEKPHVPARLVKALQDKVDARERGNVEGKKETI